MKIRTKIFLAFLLLLLPLIITAAFYLYGLSVIDKQTSSAMNYLQNINQSSLLNSTAQFIRYYDEVLTQSARNYAFTGNMIWRDRYEEAAPKLDEQIKTAIKSGDSDDQKIFSSIDAANQALVDMEQKSMDLVNAGQKDTAISILEGSEYAKQKEIYKQGLVKYVEKQGKKYDETLIASTDNITANIDYIQHLIKVGTSWTSLGIAVVLILALIFGVMIADLISRPIKRLEQTAKEIAQGNLDKKTDIVSHDEIGDLASSFNQMVDQVRQARENIEAKVRERTAQLERLNRVMTGRELKMIELKKEIAELKKGLNK